MRYLNKKTGAVIDSSFAISGGDWMLEGDTPQVQVVDEEQQKVHEIIESPQVENQQQETVTPPVNPTGANDAFDSITVAQIKQELDAFGIEYDKRANKQALYDLMMSQGE